jgi:D-3-phosphoglycerate dehydrogenase / 2-oxoglutarate reductase
VGVVRILVVGDSFVPVEAFASGLGALERDHHVRYLTLDEGRTLTPATDSERRLREYAGSPEQLVERIDGEDVLVIHGAPVTDDVLDASPDLGLVCCARGGPVNVDVAAAAERGIRVTTTPGKNAQAVVELTIAFMIMLSRGIPRAQRYLVENGRMGESTFEGAKFFGHELGGRRLGLVGYGQVGRRVAATARSLGMGVSAFDPAFAAQDIAADGVESAPLESLIADADIISLHARATAANENFFAAPQFSRMRPGALFINTARETLVDEDALLAALASGHLGGAALDVLRPRPGGERHPLLDLPNAIATPHIGGATSQTIARGVGMIADEIGRYSAGRNLLYAT